ncbi:glycoside hydrolase family 16 [Cellulomonas fimi ATCC 484]|uniref:Glycoside hydrolase family 16 n=1 Tax=Cellulomonas fimi (strain ATCC 484 / DSM 20113 / JCM 1341 / CCUG 24087 / LMG 16345 / NBRC 15513 / NCIMB 8980 / NCTC 7547 / NRS-133) TaxID=590998 RepID=F4H4N8_CELFA|nr:glycoside hydrolase family 16 [Cellulomonas fimi ATCC 484]VEH25948.1 Beta-glucanase precursor [Cellulomonas fimi]
MPQEPRVLWTDEFAGPPGSPPDPQVWRHETGAGGWGDEQVQRYTTSPRNAHVTPEHRLAITAHREPDGEITSARLTTHHRLSVRNGRVEARLRQPRGAGTWSAFWMLGDDLDEVGWPACGEIDVVEHVGAQPRTVHGTVHGPGYAGVGGGVGASHEASVPLADAFHTSAVTWSDDEIRWDLDGVVFHRVTPDDVPGPWPFRHGFHLLLNLAVGGRWPGNDATALRLPATLLVDRVRVLDVGGGGSVTLRA